MTPTQAAIEALEIALEFGNACTEERRKGMPARFMPRWRIEKIRDTLALLKAPQTEGSKRPNDTEALKFIRDMWWKEGYKFYDGPIEDNLMTEIAVAARRYAEAYIDTKEAELERKTLEIEIAVACNTELKEGFDAKIKELEAEAAQMMRVVDAAQFIRYNPMENEGELDAALDKLYTELAALDQQQAPTQAPVEAGKVCTECEGTKFVLNHYRGCNDDRSEGICSLCAAVEKPGPSCQTAETGRGGVGDQA